MRILYTILFCAGVAIATTSCERCATCTTTSDDPATFGQEITDEVCGRGRVFEDKMQVYEATWNCTEN